MASENFKKIVFLSVPGLSVIPLSEKNMTLKKVSKILPHNVTRRVYKKKTVIALGMGKLFEHNNQNNVLY